MESFFHFSTFFHVDFFQIFFSLFFLVCCSLWGLYKTQETKGGRILHLCEEAMEWKMEGCVTFCFVVWLCFRFLDAMKVISISLIWNIVTFNLIKFSLLLSLLKTFARNQSLVGNYNNQSLPSNYNKKIIIVVGNQWKVASTRMKATNWDGYIFTKDVEQSFHACFPMFYCFFPLNNLAPKWDFGCWVWSLTNVF
jgi:hypothetical protein